MDFPLPSQSDPDYGQIVQGPRYENPEGSMPMAVTRTSKHPEVAIDFLLFLASRNQNEKFNERLKVDSDRRGRKDRSLHQAV